jgi:threonine/homoserine/homoserine lactone efflux protein
MAGGIIMLLFGFSTFTKKNVSQTSNVLIEPKHPGTFRYVMKGFALNAVNPSVYILWVAMNTVAFNNNYTNPQVLLYLASIILTVFLTDLAKSYVATRLKHYLTVPLLTWINRVVGVTLLGFGFRLIYYAFKGI